MKRIPWWKPVVGLEEKILVDKVLKSNFLNDGEFTIDFERKVANLVGSKYAVAITSGTIAMYLSLKALKIGQGDKVLGSTSTNTTFAPHISTALAVAIKVIS